jgi:L-ornithine N5-oxygenase
MNYDLVGVGFGPANISLAIALEEIGWPGSVLFLERNSTPDWQSEMLLDGTDIQHHPLRDLVTPRNPQSRYGFLSFLQSQHRLFEFLNLGLTYALRKDYAAYIRWVARQFDRWTTYSQSVTAIRLNAIGNDGEPQIELSMDGGRTIRARALSIAPGRSPLVPDVFAPLIGDRVVHFTRYLTTLARWQSEAPLRSIAVVGGSQSAIEIVLDLLRRAPDVKIHNVQRGMGYRLKDTSPFTEHAYFPEFVDYFYRSGEQHQRALTADLWRSNYSAADSDVIHQLYLAMYEQRLDGNDRVRLHLHSDVETVCAGRDGGIVINLVDRNLGTRTCVVVDAVILATGFRNFGNGPDHELYHPLLSNIAPHVRLRGDGSLFVSRDYRLEPVKPQAYFPPIFINGLCESTHGFGDAGSFSLLALRSWTIAQSLLRARAARRDGASQAA